MCPVMFLSDGYIANGAEPWLIPKVEDLPRLKIEHLTEINSDKGLMPYKRNEKLARPWIKPGTKGLEHRIGGLEKADVTGNIDYSPKNHQHMVQIRAAKVAGIANYIPEQTVEGPSHGKLLLVSWGGTFGAVRTAVQQALAEGKSVAHTHLRYLNPFPRNLGTILKSYEKVLVPELNNGQLRILLRNQYLVDAQGYNKTEGKPFLVNELVNAINGMLG
jgi:2-oxoglutarate ferredoxin oxidoreductase subunit alpha